MKLLAFPSSSNARYIRLDPIGKYIQRKSANSFYVTLDPMNDNDLDNADIIILQQTISQEKIKWAWEYARKGKLLVAELDDYFGINPDNPRIKEFKESEAEKWLETLCGVADVITTTTPYLAKIIKKRLSFHGVKKDIVVLPNYLDMEVWDLPIKRNYSDEIRIVWAGSASHRNDMKFIMPVIKRVCKKYPQVKFIYCGDVKLKPLFEGINSEYVDGVTFSAWPSKLHSFRADIGIAPLLNNQFNRCKSNLKFLEYGISGIAGVYSDVVYKHTVKDGMGLIAKDQDEFFNQISKLVENRELRESIAGKAYLEVRQNYSLEDHAIDWLDTYWKHWKNKMKLDIGGGLTHVIGKNWFNVDRDARYGEILADIRNIPLPDGIALRLHCGAILEHFYLKDLRKYVLPELYRLLDKKGQLYIAVPDWTKIKSHKDWDMVQENLYGAYHEGNPAEFDLHKYCYDFEHLKKELKDAGFKRIKQVPYTERAHDSKFTLAVECYK